MDNNNDIKTRSALIQVPANAVKITVEADIIYDDLSLHKAVMELPLNDIVDCWIDGEEWERENCKYFLTDYGQELLEKEEGLD